MMERKTILVCVVVALLGLLSAATGFGAEATRIKSSQVKFNTPGFPKCSYPRSPALGLGFTAAMALMVAQIIINVQTGCICCIRGARFSSSNWTTALVCFVVSWFTFVIAFLLLLTGAVLNDQHGQQNMYFDNYYCYIVKPGVFAAGAVLSLASITLGLLYYLNLTSVKSNIDSSASVAANQGAIAMGQPQIPRQGQDPVFVHEDTYMRRQFT